MPQTASQPRSGWPWWYFPTFVGVVLLAATASASRWISPINLAGENNLATWWSGAVYFVAAVHAHRVGWRGDKADKIAWHSFGLGLILMVFTEIGSVHERIGHIAAAAALGALMGFSFLLMFRLPRYRTSAILLAAGVAMNALAVGQEWIEWAVFRPDAINLDASQAGSDDPMMGIRAAIEEGSELVASLLFLAAALKASAKGWKTEIRAVAPPLNAASEYLRLVLITFLPAIAISLITTTLTDLVNRGNPSACYPVMVYLLGAGMALAVWLNRDSERRTAYAFLAAILLFCSADSMAQYQWYALVYYPDPGPHHTVDVWASYQPQTFLAHAGLILIWGLGRKGFLSARALLILAGIAVVGTLALTTGLRGIQLAMGGITACGLFVILHSAGLWNTSEETPAC